ncbi:Uncharacterised protein [Bordetella pertussis]|nr:Uncharacterised protein [Bordetella pertussis]
MVLSRACARAVPAAMSMPMVRIGSSTLSSTFCQGSRVACWNTMPTSRRGPSMACPRSSATPAEGLSRPAATLSRVDLPQPEGPSMDRNSPSATVVLNPSSAVVGPREDR